MLIYFNGKLPIFLNASLTFISQYYFLCHAKFHRSCYSKFFEIDFIIVPLCRVQEVIIEVNFV